MRKLILAALIAFAAMPAPATAQRLVGFCASWCGPCQRVKPVLERLRSSGLPIEICDVDARERAAANGYRGEPVPLVVAYRADGREVGRLAGNECTAEAIKQLFARTSATVDGDPDADISRLSTCDPWDDARFVKIRASDGNAFDWTSGALVAIDGDASYVVSCAHGCKGRGDVVGVLFSSGSQATVGDVVAWDYRPREGVDCCLIKLRCAARKEFFQLAESEPTAGAKIYLGGFPSAGAYRGRYSVCVSLGLDLIADGKAISGESGGPVLDSRGYLCGVITATDERTTCCCRLVHVRRLLDACFPNRPGALLPPADNAPPTQAGPLSPLTPPTCDPSPRMDAIERAIAELQSGKQDRGDYLTLDALSDYAKKNELPSVPDVSGLATKGDVQEANGLIDKILPAVGSVIDDKLAAIPKPAAVATHILGVPTALALPTAMIGGPLGVAFSIAALVGYRRLKKATAAGGRQSGTFHGHHNGWGDVPIAGRIVPRDNNGHPV